MSTKLDNTDISKKDIEELKSDTNNNKKDEDDSLDKTAKSESAAKKKVKKGKSKAIDKSDSSSGHQATIPKDAGNVHATSLANIQGKLSDPKIQQEFVINVADLIGQFSKRKLTQPEVHQLQQVVETNLLQKIFKINKI